MECADQIKHKSVPVKPPCSKRFVSNLSNGQSMLTCKAILTSIFVIKIKIA